MSLFRTTFIAKALKRRNTHTPRISCPLALIDACGSPVRISTSCASSEISLRPTTKYVTLEETLVHAATLLVTIPITDACPVTENAGWSLSLRWTPSHSAISAGKRQPMPRHPPRTTKTCVPTTFLSYSFFSSVSLKR